MEINVKTKYDLGNKVFFIDSDHVAHEGVITTINVRTEKEGRFSILYSVSYDDGKKAAYCYPDELYSKADEVKEKVFKEIKTTINFL